MVNCFVAAYQARSAMTMQSRTSMSRSIVTIGRFVLLVVGRFLNR
jgi:hypothetical protein